MVIVYELHKFISGDLRDTVVINPRARSQLALLAVLAPLMATNLRAMVQPQAWALDASSFAVVNGPQSSFGAMASARLQHTHSRPTSGSA